MSQNRFKGFNVEKPSSSRVEIVLDKGNDPYYGEMSTAKPNLIDLISRKIPDTGIGGVLKGLYRGTDDTVFGLLPSGNYESITPESKFGETLSFGADPYMALKGAKYAVSGGTPISRLIANSITPQAYSNKWPELKRVLTNPKVFKEAVIDDIPQWASVHSFSNIDDRLFAWRTKLGLGKPNFKYNQALDPVGYHNYQTNKYWLQNPPVVKVMGDGTKIYGDKKQYAYTVNNFVKNNPIDKIWNRFGTHMEDGKKYYHYKNPDDYFVGSALLSDTPKHTLFGNYSLISKMKGSKDLGGELTHHYYDNWDFARNFSLRNELKNAFKFSTDKNIDKKMRKDAWKRSVTDNLPVWLQRSLAESLLNPLEFKGTAKKVYRKPKP
jgi:hypothetical protein